MKSPLVLLIVAVLALAPAAFALSPELSEWGRGPVHFLMTGEEAARWKTITTDEAAQAFVALFWARRDPTPETPRNEFREEFQSRVRYADENFAEKRVKGSMTDRGRVLILFGPPRTILRSRGQASATLAENEQREGTTWVSWVYEGGDEVTQIFGTPRAQVRFVDRFGTGDYAIERGTTNIGDAEARAVTRAIAQPSLTEASLLAPALPAAPPLPTDLTTDALRSAVADARTAALPSEATVTWIPSIAGSGEGFVPVLMSLPKTSGLSAGQSVTFFGSFLDAAGRSVAAFEIPAKVETSRDELFVAHTVRGVPAGRHQSYFGVADGARVVSIAPAEIEVPASADPSMAGTSVLILSSDVYPLKEAQPLDAPFTFGGVKVIPRASRTFRTSEELWYFVELRNPGLEELPAGGAAPRIQVRIDVAGPKKMLAPPREVEAAPFPGVPGRYGVGSSIPLASFPAGEYEFTIKVIDTVKKTSYTLSENFRVVQ